jgi:hypothetical protein
MSRLERFPDSTVQLEDIQFKTWDDLQAVPFQTQIFQLEEFTLFPKLPKEIRLKIWKDAAAIPRNVDLWIGPGDREDEDSLGLMTAIHVWFYSTSAPPAVLSTSHESR